MKNSIPGLASHPIHFEPPVDDAANPSDVIDSLSPHYDRLVLVLVDALRADFVLPYGSAGLPRMEFVAELINQNKTLSYLAKAHPPTVTMPRIKVKSVM